MSSRHRLLDYLWSVAGTLRFELRRAWWLALGRTGRRSVEVDTKQGRFRLPVGRDPISETLFILRECELDVMIDAMDVVRRAGGGEPGEGVVVDVGANNGFVSIGMLERELAARAVAIEPEPENFARLEENLRLNGFEDRVTTVRTAVSDRHRTVTLEKSPDNYGDHRVRSQPLDARELFAESGRETVEVEARPLGDVLAGLEPAFREDLRVVWIDVQGHEGRVFEGSRELFRSGVPVVSEIWPYAMRRAGVSEEAFQRIVEDLWRHYWVRREAGFVRYPIGTFPTVFDELRHDVDAFETVVFTR